MRRMMYAIKNLRTANAGGAGIRKVGHSCVCAPAAECKLAVRQSPVMAIYNEICFSACFFSISVHVFLLCGVCFYDVTCTLRLWCFYDFVVDSGGVHVVPLSSFSVVGP